MSVQARQPQWVVQLLGERLHLVQYRPKPRELPDCQEGAIQLESYVDSLLQRGSTLRQTGNGDQRLLEQLHRIPVRRACRRLARALARIGHGLFPHLASESVTGELLRL